MATTPTGLIVPAGTDVFDPDGDLRTLAGSLDGRLIVPVANTTARDALAAAFTPSTAKPLLVYRSDAGTLECSVGGSGTTAWTKLAGPRQYAAAGQTDFATTAIDSPTAVRTLASVAFTMATTGTLRVDLDMTLRSDGQAQAWVDIYVGSTKLDSRFVDTNTLTVGAADIHGDYTVAAGSHALTVRAAKASAAGTSLRFNSGKVRLSW
ncbi:hypothetical protein [Oerskovia rustica]|uniref:Uncharacterized protein n=1 Tax=Oerskovia rustica TaxID=2762237 RepID=A0ABR8RQ42_9CELL|nr:hypothetical protein [Oerskovia rustica]MBD7949582.1 hypothetical protein [Oerskovia rustica]